jgi:8-oxo-dGTP pyrophosphatase MutT (NUDIX family)
VTGLNPDLPAQLTARLQQPLPGWAAQVRYQPELSFGRHLGPAPSNARPAAVLVLLYPQSGQWHVPLILRPAHMPDHASQVSFPGGVIEPGEESRQAALREFSEELGAPAEGIELLGQLSELYLFASNFRITPWVGVAGVAPRWNPSRDEVDRLLEIPLRHLLDPAQTSSIERRQRGLGFRAPCFCWESERIWGATSMILAELVSSLAELSI